MCVGNMEDNRQLARLTDEISNLFKVSATMAHVHSLLSVVQCRSCSNNGSDTHDHDDHAVGSQGASQVYTPELQEQERGHNEASPTEAFDIGPDISNKQCDLNIHCRIRPGSIRNISGVSANASIDCAQTCGISCVFHVKSHVRTWYWTKAVGDARGVPLHTLRALDSTRLCGLPYQVWLGNGMKKWLVRHQNLARPIVDKSQRRACRASSAIGQTLCTDRLCVSRILQSMCKAALRCGRILRYSCTLRPQRMHAIPLHQDKLSLE